MSAVCRQFIDHLKLKGFSQATIQNYVQCVSRCVRHCNKPPLSLSHDDIGKYLLHLKEVRHHAPKTINQVFYALRCFYGHFYPNRNIMDGFGRMKEPFKVPEVLSKEEVETLIASCTDLRTRAIVAVLYSSGIRLGECADLKITDVDSKRMVLRINSGKGGRDRYAVLSQRALVLLRQYYRTFRPKHWLFENHKHTSPVLRRRMQQLVHDAGIRAGIKKPVAAHILRHTFATHMLEAKIPLPVIQRFLGHTNISTTVKYSHVSGEMLNSVGSPFDAPKKPAEKP